VALVSRCVLRLDEAAGFFAFEVVVLLLGLVLVLLGFDVVDLEEENVAGIASELANTNCTMALST
jgi:hypothetical protein